MKSLLDQIIEEWENKGLDPVALLNKMIEQWEARGIDPNIMLDKLKNSPASNDTTVSLDTYEGLNFEIKDEDLESFDLLNPFSEWDEDTLEYNKESKASLTQMKAISCGALATFNHQLYLNSFQTGLQKQEAQRLLKDWWGVNDKLSLRKCISQIENREHSRLWDIIWNALQTFPVELWEESEDDIFALIEDEVDNLEQAEIFLYNIVDVYAFLADFLKIDSKGTYSIEAWDLCRGINICRWAYDAEYCSEKEAEQCIMRFAKQLYSKYKSWESMSISYILGAAMKDGNIDTVNDLLHAHHVLLNNSKSPWQLIDW